MKSPPRNIGDLIDFDVKTGRVQSREGKHREFKATYIPDDIAQYTKTLASFANADGGVLIFGVSDKPRQIVGVDPDAIPDEADFTNRLRSDFHPEIAFQTRTYEVAGKTLFVICVEQHVGRPVICAKGRSKRVSNAKKGDSDIIITQEGFIYYRYAAQTRPISFTELTTLLEERERRQIKSILETLRLAERVGYDRVGIVDASTFSKANTATNLYVSRETAKHLNFIDKGRFVETTEDGDPAYVVLGQVHLNEVIHAPLDDADRNLPGEVAKKLSPFVKKLCGCEIAPQQVTKLLSHYGLTDLPYQHYDDKLRRRLITRGGIDELRLRIERDPQDALRAFASRRAIEAFAAHGKPGAAR